MIVDDPRISRRALIVGGALLCAAGGAYAITPRRSEKLLGATKLGSLIPDSAGPWRRVNREGIVVAREEEGAPADGYDQVLTRTYAADGLPDIMLLLAYGSTQGGSLRLHRPETCYPGQGFALREFREVDYRFAPDAAVIRGRTFTAVRDERIERVSYWTRVSDRFPLNTAELYAAILASTLRGTVPDGILVRVSAIGGDVSVSDSALSQFLQALVAHSSLRGRQVMLGPSAAGNSAGA